MTQCQCLTKNGQGSQCSRQINDGNQFCSQHQNCSHPVNSIKQQIDKPISKSILIKPSKQQIETPINLPDISSLALSSKCSLTSLKIIPFLVRISKRLPNRICNIRSGLFNQKQFNSTITIDFNNDLHKSPMIHYPPNLVKNINQCQEPMIIINLGLIEIFQGNGHSNLLIIDRLKNEIEHFEPHGEFSRSSEQSNIIMNIVKNLMFKILPSYKFISTLEYCPKIGPQIKQKNNTNCSHGGYCVVWSILYGYLRLLNPTYSRKEIVDFMLGQINLTYLRQFITYIDTIVSDQEILQWTEKSEQYID